MMQQWLSADWGDEKAVFQSFPSCQLNSRQSNNWPTADQLCWPNCG